MGAFVRKNLMVDADAERALAQQRGTSESEAVRWAVEQALGWRETADALRAIADTGMFDDAERNEALYGPGANAPIRAGLFDELLADDERPRQHKLRAAKRPSAAAD